jgi:hypothetical protein
VVVVVVVVVIGVKWVVGGLVVGIRSAALPLLLSLFLFRVQWVSNKIPK